MRLLLVLVAYGCAHVHAPHPTHAPLPVLYVTVPSEHLQAICKGLDRVAQYRTYFGCVDRDYANNVCVVYTESKPPQWLLREEEQHCRGYSH